MNVSKILYLLEALKNEISLSFKISTEQIESFYPILRKQAVIYDVTTTIESLLLISIVVISSLALFIIVLEVILALLPLRRSDYLLGNAFTRKLIKVLTITLIILIIAIIVVIIYKTLSTFEYRMLLDCLKLVK